MARQRLKRARPFPFSPLSRAVAGQSVLIFWEGILPFFVPFVLWAGFVALAGQWGLWGYLAKWPHFSNSQGLIVFGGFVLAAVAAFRSLKHLIKPSFSDIIARLAYDNGLRPEALIGMRHATKQPHLKLGKARASFAKGDPLALRYLLVLGFIMGWLIAPPAKFEQVLDGFMPQNLHVMAKVLRPAPQ